MSRILSSVGVTVIVAGFASAPAIRGVAARSQAGVPPAIQASSPDPVSQHSALLKQYCVRCHSERLHTGSLSLEQMDVANLAPGADVWERVITKVRSGQMPPPNAPRPDQASLDGFAGWLEDGLDRAAAAAPNPGRVAVHRLNRTEYANAIRDLLGLPIDSHAVLIDEDPGVSGFDNTASTLSVSPVLMERYIAEARRISRLAVGGSASQPIFESYNVPKMLSQDGRTSEDLPFASRGGLAVRHQFPADGDYIVKIRLRSQLYQYIEGLGEPHPVEVRLDGERIEQFTVGGDAPGRPAPDSFAGNVFGDSAWEKYMHDADARLEVRFHAKAGTRLVGVSFPEYTPEPEGVVQPRQTGQSGVPYNQLYYENPAIETISIGGPFDAQGPGDTPSRRKIFVCRPKAPAGEQACATQILSTLARRAYRRPVTEDDRRTLRAFYESGRAHGSFDAGIESALTRILVDPEFLVRIETPPLDAKPGTVFRLNDLAVASRLSFFLWSSLPDDELLDLAVRGQLRNPRVLEQQVRRMFADTRSAALVTSFGSQWLNLSKLRGAEPNPDDFPDFDENLRDAFEEETRLFLDNQIRADRSVSDLISADYSFLNERLARHYGIPNIYGDSFRRVAFANGHRGGLLGQGSVLTVTSYANRTSPVFRGKFVLDTLLNMPPPQPPPNVPDLKEAEEDKAPRSMRERMQEHRDNPACSGCHARMDPLGFALENFNGVGQWRDVNEDGSRIDASDALPDGTRLDGVAGLRAFILNRRPQFAEAIIQKLLAYALGRDIEYFDRPAVRQIVREAAARDYRWSAIVEAIVKSVPFQMSVVKEQPAN